MGFFDLIFAVVLVGAIAKVMQARYHSRVHLPAEPPLFSADASRLTEEVRQLRERVAVLERVVTDNHGSIDLDRQIEALRHRQEEPK